MRQIMALREKLETMRRWWTAETTVYLTREERTEGDGTYLRPRELEEYPEAQRRYWSGTVAAVDAMIQDLQTLREHCVAEYHKTPE